VASIPTWLLILLIIISIVQHIEYRRRLYMKDRRITELEGLLSQYRNHTAGLIDVDNVNELLPGPGGEGEAHTGLDLKIDV
jgi:hypothetical protein